LVIIKRLVVMIMEVGVGAGCVHHCLQDLLELRLEELKGWYAFGLGFQKGWRPLAVCLWIKA